MFVTILVSWHTSSPIQRGHVHLLISYFANYFWSCNKVPRTPLHKRTPNHLFTPVLTPTALCSSGRTVIIIRLSLSCISFYMASLCTVRMYDTHLVKSSRFHFPWGSGKGMVGKRGFHCYTKGIILDSSGECWCHSNWQNNHHHHHQTLCISCFF